MKRVAIVEDDPGLREQLARILKTAPGIKCVGAYESAEEALESLPGVKPDIVLMDIRLPKMSGIECVAKLKEMMPSVQIIMVTVYGFRRSAVGAVWVGGGVVSVLGLGVWLTGLTFFHLY